MLSDLWQFILWFKAEYPALFELIAFATTVGSAVFAVRRFMRNRKRELKYALEGRRFELKRIDEDNAATRTATTKLLLAARTLDDETKALSARTAVSALQRAEQQRQQGNHETAIGILSDWHKAEGRHLAAAAGLLARDHIDVVGGSAGGFDRQLTAERLAAIQDLAASAPARPANGRGGNV